MTTKELAAIAIRYAQSKRSSEISRVLAEALCSFSKRTRDAQREQSLRFLESEDENIKQAVYNLYKTAATNQCNREKELKAAIAEYACSYELEFNSELPVPAFLQSTLLALKNEEALSEELVVNIIDQHIAEWNKVLEFGKWVRSELERIERNDALSD